jgi:hypothetical protein
MAKTPGKDDSLKQLLRSAGFQYQNVDRKYVQLLFGSPWRSWVVGATLNENWLSLVVYICEIPETAIAKASLFELAMRLSDEASLAKYTHRGAALNLELQYRAEHVDAEVLENLVGLLLARANKDYPQIVRHILSEDVLERLGKQFDV